MPLHHKEELAQKALEFMADTNTTTEAARIAGGASLVTLYGITLSEWVALVTLLYLSIQIFILLPKAAAIIKRWVGR